LAGEEGQALLDELLQSSPTAHPPDDVLVGLRAGCIDEYVAYRVRATGEFRQVVLLGAGLDTRAARLAHRDVTFYEVDHPASQAYKRSRVRDLHGYPEDAAKYVPCDFEVDDPIAMLADAGFRPEAPALFVLEGVVHYLKDAVIRRLLLPIATQCSPKSTVIFDYLSHILEEDREAFDVSSNYGEPVLWTNRNPLSLLHDVGFRHVRTTGFDQLYMSATMECCTGTSFIHTCFLARATRQTPVSAYLW